MADAGDVERQPVEVRRPDEEPGRSPAAGVRDDQPRLGDAADGELPGDLVRGRHVPERPDSVRASDRERGHLAALGRGLGDQPVVGPARLLSVAADVHVRAEEVVEQDVAGPFVRVAVTRNLRGEHEFAPQPQLRAGRGGLAAVIGLQRAEGDHRVDAGLDRRAEQELEFAQLVTAQAERMHVVPFEQQVRQAESLAEPGCRMQRRRMATEVDAGKAIEVHAGHVTTPRLLGGIVRLNERDTQGES